MHRVVPLRQRDPYLADIERMLETPVDLPEGCQLIYACRDREAAGKLSRRLRGEIKRRDWRATTRQYRSHVYVWKDLLPREQEVVMRKIGEAASELLTSRHLRAVPDGHSTRTI